MQERETHKRCWTRQRIIFVFSFELWWRILFSGGRRDYRHRPKSNPLNRMWTDRGRPGRAPTGERSGFHVLPRNPTTVPGRIPPIYFQNKWMQKRPIKLKINWVCVLPLPRLGRIDVGAICPGEDRRPLWSRRVARASRSNDYRTDIRRHLG